MKTILLVDDEIECLRCLGEVLNRLEYKVIAKMDGQAALSVVNDGISVDLVIADYLLPDMDGLELLIALKQLVPDIPLIMLTGNSTIEIYQKALGLGVYEFVSKPVKAKELDRIVKAALDGN